MVDVRVIRQIDAGSSCGSTNSWTMVEVRVVRQIDSGTSYLTSLCSFILHVCMHCCKLVSEYLLYFENCADNATLTFSFHWMRLFTSLIIPDKEKYSWFDCV
jgi:hypothetical protein